MMLADAMSRQPSSESTQIDLDIQVSFVQFSTQKLQSIREATQADDELCALRAVIVDGWPDSQRQPSCTVATLLVMPRRVGS